MVVIADPGGALIPVLGGRADPLWSFSGGLESRPAREAPPILAGKLQAESPPDGRLRITQSRWDNGGLEGNVLPPPK
jgi:hypothetical protein